MEVPIYIFPQKVVKGKLTHDIVATYLGYAEVEKFNAEDIWNLCNWSHYLEAKPENLHANIDICTHGLCLINPETQERWLALSHGWLTAKDEKVISEYVFMNRDKVLWI